MKILEYDDIDPFDAFQVSMLALEFALTPEHVAHIRQTDPRPFPFFAIYAVEDDLVLGQVGVFRLPMISIDGREDVGGVWAVSTHPQHSGRSVASMLLDEAHKRMRDAGLRFSTLGTNRYRVGYKLYQRHGYEDTQVLATALARWETAHRPTRLRARQLGNAGYDLVEKIFQQVASNYLGFAWRHTPFAPLRDKVSSDDVWILEQNNHPLGYAFAHLNKSTLEINCLLVPTEIDTTEAVAAVVAQFKASYVKVKVTRPVEVASLKRAGFQVAQPTWGAFMLKPLTPHVTLEDARRLFGIGTDRFLISWLDTT
ncbi:MAG: GNAT family N-acetyltransferase [Chloroflexi bacterium]|nr:GNAT family N-acetyltransferase [Chloroflexota bacterium]